MMAWILVSLLASYTSGAVAFSPDATGSQATADASIGPNGDMADDGWLPPPKP